MKIDLTSEHLSEQAAFRNFVNEEVVPFADAYDQQERIPRAVD